MNLKPQCDPKRGEAAATAILVALNPSLIIHNYEHGALQYIM